MPARFVIKKDRSGEYRWSLVAPNGKMIADSGEGYVDARGARAGIKSVQRFAPDAMVEDGQTSTAPPAAARGRAMPAATRGARSATTSRAATSRPARTRTSKPAARTTRRAAAGTSGRSKTTPRRAR